MSGRRTYRTRTTILDRTKLGEQDLILTMLSDTGGEVRAVAKGGRKPGGRLAARCELFCECDMLLARGRNLDVVSEATLVDPHPGLRGDLDRVSAASAVCEVARLTCFDGIEDRFLPAILSRALRALEEAPDRAHLDLVVAAYVLKVLAHGGWRPELDSCIACGEAGPLFFSAASGGLLCESCARDVEGAEPVVPSEVEWLRALLTLTFDELVAVPLTDDCALTLACRAHVWAATHLDARLRAFEFMLSV